MSSSTVDQYLAVLKASYDYQPQPGADDEIAIKEDPLLFLVERVDDDWWKVKVKGDNLDEDSPVGLVPAAYVEPVSASSDLRFSRQRIPTSVVRAVYDYATNAPGELTVVEDNVLYVFDTEDEWLLVQSKAGDKAGYVPGNYVEAITEEEAEAGTSATAAAAAEETDDESAAPQVVVPPSPPRPEYIDPADRVANTRGASAADPILTWAISEVDKKGKKKKGTLGVGNGSVFFASESDKGPVQKWSTKQVDLIAIEKHKHLHVVIIDGNGTPVELHFHTGGKETADAIQEKLEASKALAVEADAQMMGEITGKTSHEQMDHGVDDIELDKRLDQIEVPALPPPAKKPTVHFSSAEPVIIPAPDDDEEEEVEVGEGEHVVAAYDFHADGDDELSVAENETLVVLEKDGEWWKCRNALGAEGVVPASYLEVIHDPSQPTSVPDLQDAQRKKEEELRRREEELSRREQEQRAREEERKRKQMEQQERAKAMVKERQEVEMRGRTNSSPPKADATGGSHVSRPSTSGGGRKSGEVPRERPDPNRTRIWHDRTGQFRVEAAFLGMTNGKIRLHKVNGVVVEVPEEKMSLDDMRYIERLTNGNSSPPTSNPKPPVRPPQAKKMSEDDVPLALTRAKSVGATQNGGPRKPRIDWFEFFLSAGCDIDDCTRYASSFERDKIDEAILPDITESTMRSIGLREGDIIRVSKLIQQRKPKLEEPSAIVQEQIRKDEELAQQLQAEEQGRKTAPNLFTEPGGILKGAAKPRRGRPEPRKSLPPTFVESSSIAADTAIPRTGTPQQISAPATATTPIQVPPRASSAAAKVSGFDDDAWTNRPSSTQPLAPTPPVQIPRPPTAPPGTTAPAPTTAAPPVPPIPATTAQNANNLVNTTNADIFDQLARLSELRKTQTPAAPSLANTRSTLTSPTGFSSGMGIGPSPMPIGQHLQQPQQPQQPQPQQPYNGPRGPFAPVPTNSMMLQPSQGLLQPLVPTRTGFAGLVPTRTGMSHSPFTQPAASPFAGGVPVSQFLTSQPTGFPGAQGPLMSHPTGFTGMSGPLMSQPTGMFNASPPHSFSPSPFNGRIQSQPTGFNPNFGQFGGSISPPPPVPPLPSMNTINSNASSTSPANVFAQMKSGTFATDTSSAPQSSDRYDVLRPAPITTQPTGWVSGSYMGYRQ
ncbi:hypothetical protein FISHEDRAFT_63096 [Fistulina hepatica ATCC 64428]|uniref:Actin cytoskeleton-regulatory complex protein SLA1 n=1 Tax=Fistulina hepatica ATCC 64428 TaxID=1128425 RepID=A0A0D6ZZD6_9AGAR|nr:hypothetical protein FISHEDRAFT_63096 [Fistulina hepatica ATCC 64428]